MAIVTIDDAKLTNIADAIRSKAGTSATLTTDEMPTAISNIATAPEYGYLVGVKGTSRPSSAILDFQNYTGLVAYTSLVTGTRIYGNYVPDYAFFNWGTQVGTSLSSYGVTTPIITEGFFRSVTGDSTLQIVNADTVIYVGTNAFYGSFYHSGSRSYKIDIATTFPNLRAVQTHGFSSCSRFTINDELPENIEWIGNFAFYFECGSSSVSKNPALNFTRIPASCKYIGNMAFAGHGGYEAYLARSSDRTSLTFEGTPQYIGNNAFSHYKLVNTITDVYVPWDESDTINANAPWGLTNATFHYNHTEE